MPSMAAANGTREEDQDKSSTKQKEGCLSLDQTGRIVFRPAFLSRFCLHEGSKARRTLRAPPLLCIFPC